MIQKWWVQRKKWIWNIYTPDKIVLEDDVVNDLPWLNATKINSAIEIEGSSWSSWKKTLTFTRAKTVWTWNQSFTWFWFTPKSYEIIAWRNTLWFACMCFTWRDDAWVEWWVALTPNWASLSETNPTTSSMRILYWNAWWGSTIAWFISLDSDWITLNFTASGEDIKFKLTCFS